jgi:tight adherence protein C
MITLNAIRFILITVSVFSAIMIFAFPIFRKRIIANRIGLKQRIDRDGNVSSLYKHQLRSRMMVIVDRLNLKARLADEATYSTLRSAGFRGEHPIYLFLFLRFALPLASLCVALVVVFGLGLFNSQAFYTRVIVCIVVAYVGFYAPNLYVKNRIKKRLSSIGAAWPDALDLAIICTESGMTVEASFRKVAAEIGLQSVELAQELMLTVAEMQMLPERKAAYDNLVERVKLEQLRPVALALTQAERYGTPIGQALRTLSKEAREAKVVEAERKAAALPPKLTVPMIVFFLPVLFAFILGPAIIRLVYQ